MKHLFYDRIEIAKFRYSEKANLPLFFWHYLVASNYKWKMGQIFVAFSEYQNFTQTISKSFEVNRFQYKTWPWKLSIPLLQCRDLGHTNKTSSLLKFWKILIHQVEEKISKTATAICNMTWLHAIVYCHRVFCYDS